jgi:hypothetical protein
VVLLSLSSSVYALVEIIEREPDGIIIKEIKIRVANKSFFIIMDL